MANTLGDILVIGVTETDGLPKHILGITAMLIGLILRQCASNEAVSDVRKASYSRRAVDGNSESLRVGIERRCFRAFSRFREREASIGISLRRFKSRAASAN